MYILCGKESGKLFLRRKTEKYNVWFWAERFGPSRFNLCWRTFKSMMSITRNLPLVIWLQCWNSRFKKFATSWPNYLYSGPIYSTQHMQCNSSVETKRNYIILQHRWKCYDTRQNRGPPILPFKLSLMVSRTWSFIPSQSGLFFPWFNRSIDNFQLHNCLWSVDNKMANRLCWAIN